MAQALKRLPWRTPKRLAAGIRAYVIADVHGHARALASALARIDAQPPAEGLRTITIFLGDYIDRGPASREVLDMIVERSIDNEVLTLKGNHEAMLLEFMANPSLLAQWRHNGGLQTLISYGLAPSLNPTAAEQRDLAQALAERLPREHKALLEHMPLSFSLGDFFFVHAGVRPGVALRDQKEEDLLWIREDFLFHERDYEKIVIHGHTPVTEAEVHRNRINLDTGAYATGRLSCLMIEGDKLAFL